MPLSWNEIKHRAIAFSKEWKHETREDAEAKSFWDAFFNVFGVPRRTVASFEEPVRTRTGDWGYIDLFWPGVLLAEHKSAGRDLDKAHSQGMGYIRALCDGGRLSESPRYLIVSDFQRIAIHDLEPEVDPDAPLFVRLPPSFEFPLADLHKHIRHFFFIAGYKQHKLNPEDPANEVATQLMCDLHDALEDGEYGTDSVTGRAGHELKQFLVRLLFCLFGEDNGIFPTRAFQLYITDHTSRDGSDLGPKLGQLFEVLNTPEDRRQRNLESDLLQFEYINGDLFAERLALPAFTSVMREKLLACAAFDWSRISPAVFGSLFQAVMEPRERRQIGAHYTAEHNILKVVRSLFLDDLRTEFEAAKASARSKNRLKALQQKIASLRFFDPACGCGNFLVITYRELRALELEILIELHAGQQQMGEADVFSLSLIDVDQMYGIEIEEFPGRIAEVALWLTDHQANVRLSEAFGQFYKRIPLRKSPHIVVANALRHDWGSVLAPAQCSYILGNPPFIGSKLLTPAQKEDVQLVFGKIPCVGVLDYVACWYRCCVRYCSSNRSIQCALVSTNSITQGEQVSALWPDLFNSGLKINFAHRTFQWESEARGKAHVHCVIIGFGLTDISPKTLFDYPSLRGDPQPRSVSRINCYLIDAANIAIPPRLKPICRVKPMVNGSIPADGGHLLLSNEERRILIDQFPQAAPYVREYVGAEGLINGNDRHCLWLAACPPNVIRNIAPIMDRLELVRSTRLASPKVATQRKAQTPALFTEDRQPTSGNYLAFPRTSSENRRYVPIAYLSSEVIAANDIQMVPDATIFDFGILTSAMHMAWMTTVTGRLKSDPRYSSKIVYNNFPWPESITPAQQIVVEAAAQRVLDVRRAFPDSTLADLYDPLAMPPALASAHETLDRAVDKCYRRDSFASDRARVEHLFGLYERLAAPLLPPAAARRGPPRRLRPQSRTT